MYQPDCRSSAAHPGKAPLGLKESNRSDCDIAPETNVYVRAWFATSRQVIAIIRETIRFVPITQWQGIWVKRTPNDFGLGICRLEMRNIHIVKEARFNVPGHEFFQDGRYPGPGASPVEIFCLLVPMRNRDPRPAVQHRLADRCHRPGIMNVRAKIGSMIDPAQNPFGIGHKLQQPQPSAVSRRSMHGESIRSALLDPNRAFPRHRMAYAGLRASRRHDDGFAQRLSRSDQRLQPLGVDSIIITYQNLHLHFSVRPKVD